MTSACGAAGESRCERLCLLHFSICAEKIKQRGKKTSCKILCRRLSVGNRHLMSPDSSKTRGGGGVGVGGALPFDVQPLSFLLCDQLFEEPFVGVRCLWKGETSPRFSSGWEWESGWERGLSSQRGLRGWGDGAILTEEDTGLASASEKEGEEAAPEAFPRMRGRRE